MFTSNIYATKNESNMPETCLKFPSLSEINKVASLAPDGCILDNVKSLVSTRLYVFFYKELGIRPTTEDSLK